nr:putative reverse transcriptase domain, ribonuclease H-like domain, aspartic peptidase domain protein [Tanacetum cinerariifolium]
MLVDTLLQHEVEGQVSRMVEKVRGLKIKQEVVEVAKEVAEVAKEVVEVAKLAKEVVEMAKKVIRVVKEVVEVQTRGREAAVGIAWEDLRLVPHLVTLENIRIERYICGLVPQICGMVAATEPTTIQTVVLKVKMLTDEAIRNVSLRKSAEKRGNDQEPSRDGNARDDNKRSRTGKAFATITNPVRKEHIGTAPKCPNCNYYHQLEVDRAPRPGGNRLNQVMAIKGGQGCRINGSKSRGRGFVIGAEEARQDPNIVTGTFTLNNHYNTTLFDYGADYSFVSTSFIPLLYIKPSNLGFSYEDEIASDQLIEIRDGLVVQAQGRDRLPRKGVVKSTQRTPGQGFHLTKFIAMGNTSIIRQEKGNAVRARRLGRSDGALYYLYRIQVPLTGNVRTLIMDEAYKSKYSVHPEADKMYYNLKDMLTKSAYFLPIREDFKMDRLARIYLNKIVARHGVPISIISDRDSRFTSRFWQSMQEALGTQLDMRPEIIQETTKKIPQIKDRLKTTCDHQKSHADERRIPLEFSVGDHVLLKVLPWKGIVYFDKKGKLAPRFVRPFEIIERICSVAYRLRLPQALNGVHDMFHVSNLKNCLAEPTLQIPLEEIQVNAKLNFVEEPVEILERKFKKLKRSRISIVKVRWNLKRGPEFA